jgi:hypothetical protein
VRRYKYFLIIFMFSPIINISTDQKLIIPIPPACFLRTMPVRRHFLDFGHSIIQVNVCED